MDSSDLFTQEFSQEKLLETYHNHVAQTNAIGIDRLSKVQFEQQLDQHIGILKRPILELTGSHNTERN